MKTSDFYYDLPQRLIAQHPAQPRDASRMLVCNSNNATTLDSTFRAFPTYLRPGDVLVLNHTRVIPARLLGVKKDTLVPVEVLLLRRHSRDCWEALVRPGRRLKAGVQVIFGDGALIATIGETTSAGGRMVHFAYDGVFEQILDALGQMPLPPYITEQLTDSSQYQTVYAKHDGSAAAPTAGLHFTSEILDTVRALGVDIVPILLHVGLGTFRPVKVDDVADHRMHAEYYSISQEAAAAIAKAKEAGGRVIAVGTTTTRTLEAAALKHGRVTADSGWTDIFIFPGFEFRVVDALITNFHLPRSTLLMLVSAMAGKDLIFQAYQAAIESRYRFFSFGDAMLIL